MTNVGDQRVDLAGECDLGQLQRDLWAAGELTGLLDVDDCAVNGCAARNGYGAVGDDVIEDDGVKGCAGLGALAAQPLIDADAKHGSRGYGNGLAGLLGAVGLGPVGVLLRWLHMLPAEERGPCCCGYWPCCGGYRRLLAVIVLAADS